MEKRLGVVAILIEEKTSVNSLNTILSDFGELIYGRQGLPIRDKGVHVISLIVEGTTDEIGALTGKIGRLPGIQVKSLLTRYKEPNDATKGTH